VRSLVFACIATFRFAQFRADTVSKLQHEGALAELAEVLIVNSQNWQGLSRLPRTLHRAGCRVGVLGIPRGAILRSRFVAEHFETPANTPAVIEGLRGHLEKHAQRYHWVIFGDEPALFEAVKRGEEAWLKPWLPVAPNSPALAMIASKASFADGCVAHGIPTPASRLCATLDEAQSAARDIGYPIMLKKPQGFSGLGVHKANTPDQIAEGFAAWTERPLLVQKFQPGKVGACEILFDHGTPVCWFASYLAKTAGAYGPSSVRAIMTHPQLETLLTGIGQMTNYHGLCGIDWIHDNQDDGLYLLEFNARPTTCYHLGRFAGVDFAKSIAAFLAGQQLVQRPQVGPHPPKIYLFPQHINQCFDEGDLHELVYWLPFVGAHDIPWDEPRILTRQVLKTGWMAARNGVRLVKNGLRRLTGSGPQG